MSTEQQTPCYTVASEAISAGYFPDDGATVNYGVFSRSYSRSPSMALAKGSLAQRNTLRDPSAAAVIAGSVKFKKSKTSLKDRGPTGGVTKTFSSLFSSRFSTVPTRRCASARLGLLQSRAAVLRQCPYLQLVFDTCALFGQGSGANNEPSLRWDVHPGEQ